MSPPHRLVPCCDPPPADDWAESLRPGIGGAEGLRTFLAEARAGETAAATQAAVAEALTSAVAAAVEVGHVPRWGLQQPPSCMHSPCLPTHPPCCMQGGVAAALQGHPPRRPKALNPEP